MIEAGSALFNANPEIGELVLERGKLVIFLGVKDSFVKLAGVKWREKYGVFYALKEEFKVSEPRDTAALAGLYKSSLEFHEGTIDADEDLEPEIEDMIQTSRTRAYELATIAIQRIRELHEPYNVDGASVYLDFLERRGAAAQAVENQRAVLAEARERRRIEMGHEPFDAHTYYAGLRAIGADPLVAGNEQEGFGEYLSIEGLTGDNKPLHRWAIYEDPDHQLCSAYMRAMWEARPRSDLPTQFQRIPLGV